MSYTYITLHRELSVFFGIPNKHNNGKKVLQYSNLFPKIKAFSPLLQRFNKCYVLLEGHKLVNLKFFDHTYYYLFA